MKKSIITIFILASVFINNLHPYQMYLLNGPTGIGGLKMMRDYKKIYIKIINSPENMISSIIKGETDIAAVPANMAAIIFNRNIRYKAAAVISEAKVFIASSDNKIQTINDLRNKTIYCGAKLAASDLMLRYLISKEKIRNVNINYSFSNPDLAKAVFSKNAVIAVLPEPFLSSAMLENEDVHIVADISKYTENYPVAVLIVKDTFVDNNRALLKEVLEEYKKSTEYVLNNKNEIENLLEKSSMIVNPKAVVYGLSRMGLTFYGGAKMKFALNSYYNFLYNFDKKIIGGKIPADDFYYTD